MSHPDMVHFRFSCVNTKTVLAGSCGLAFWIVAFAAPASILAFAQAMHSYRLQPVSTSPPATALSYNRCKIESCNQLAPRHLILPDTSQPPATPLLSDMVHVTLIPAYDCPSCHFQHCRHFNLCVSVIKQLHCP